MSTLPDLYENALSTALEIERLTNKKDEPRLSSNLEYRSPNETH